HSGRLIGLLFHWETSGDAAEGERFRDYVHLFLNPEGIYVSPNVNFPGPVAGGPPKGLNDGSMFFHAFGGMHALIEYYQLTKDPVLADALISMADSVLAAPSKQPSME